MGTTWSEHVERWRDCQACPLGKQRGRICLARGTVPCDVLFVGEAPGASEDALGLPFVGPAGRLLDQVIDRALGGYLTHDAGGAPVPVTFALTNLVACFPREAKEAGDNEPSVGEILACRPRLVEFVNVAQPRLIVTVGGLAKAYLGFDRSVPLCHITHPASILRMPFAQKGMAVQQCIVKVRRAYEDLPGRTPFAEWGRGEDAEVEAKRQRDHADDVPF